MSQDAPGASAGSPAPQADKEYYVSFFRPPTEHARANKRLISIMVVIWAVGVFGFQVALMILNKPVPEDSYKLYEANWSAVQDGSASAEQLREFARSLLFVLGKNVALEGNVVGKATERQASDLAVTRQALSWTVASLLPVELRTAIVGVEKLPEDKGPLVTAAATAIGLSNEGDLSNEKYDKLMRDLLPMSLVPVASADMPELVKSSLPQIMDTYLIHNRNVLTDAKFIGFPFHYWYTAQFLLIMFVLLCLIYAIIIDRLHKKHHVVEE